MGAKPCGRRILSTRNGGEVARAEPETERGNAICDNPHKWGRGGRYAAFLPSAFA